MSVFAFGEYWVARGARAGFARRPVVCGVREAEGQI